jgi:hypothetical protein
MSLYHSTWKEWNNETSSYMSWIPEELTQNILQSIRSDACYDLLKREDKALVEVQGVCETCSEPHLIDIEYVYNSEDEISVIDEYQTAVCSSCGLVSHHDTYIGVCSDCGISLCGECGISFCPYTHGCPYSEWCKVAKCPLHNRICEKCGLSSVYHCKYGISNPDSCSRA